MELRGWGFIYISKSFQYGFEGILFKVTDFSFGISMLKNAVIQG